MCCGNKNYSGSNFNYKSIPQTTTGTNQKLIKQMEYQQKQQQQMQQMQQIQQVIQRSMNPNKTLIKTYK